MAVDSEDRVKLSLKKAELENHKKKHLKMQVQYPPPLILAFIDLVNIFLFLTDVFCLFFRMDDCKDRIRGVLKGRLPPDKDLKKEITQALRLL